VLVNGKLGDGEEDLLTRFGRSAAQRMPASFFFKSRMMSRKLAEGDGQIAPRIAEAD